MSFNQEDFCKAIKDIERIVMRVLSGKNEDQRKLLKMKLQDFQNLCESPDISNQIDTNMKTDNSEINVENSLNHIKHETKDAGASNEEICEKKVLKRPLAKKHNIGSDVKKVKLDRKVDLPNEIWMKIMSYMKSIDLFQNVSLVCKHFLLQHISLHLCVYCKSVCKQDSHFETSQRISHSP